MGEFFMVALVAIIYEGLLGNLWLGGDKTGEMAPAAAAVSPLIATTYDDSRKYGFLLVFSNAGGWQMPINIIY